MNISRSLRSIFCSFIYSRGLRHIIRDGYFLQYLKNFLIVYKDINKEKERKFKYDLSFVIAVKNEAPYIKEWIEYHKLVGVKKFYIYDNESTDNILEVLTPYIQEGIVEYIYWGGKAQQRNMYNHALFNHKYETKWLGFIDADEFVVPVKTNDIPELLKEYDGFSALSIHWCIYGSNNKKKKTKGLVIERFTKRANDNFSRNTEIKSIVNPRFIIGMDVHIPYVFRSYNPVDENFKKIFSHKNNPFSINKIRINHYYCKSKEEFIAKKSRGDCLNKNKFYDMSQFIFNDKNDIEDNIMNKYVKYLKNKV